MATFTYPHLNLSQVPENSKDTPQCLSRLDDVDKYCLTVRFPHMDDIRAPYITMTTFSCVINKFIQEIENEAGAWILIQPPLDDTQNEGPRERICVIQGQQAAVHVALIRILVLFDNLYGLDDEWHDVDKRLHKIIANGKYLDLEYIENDTSTNIYMTPPLHHSSKTAPYAKRIWITGETDNVKRAWNNLLNYCLEKSFMRVELHFHPRKIEWMISSNTDKIRQIMSSNDTHIWIPYSEASSNSVYIYGDDKRKIKCTVRAIFRLARDFVTASFKVIETPFPSTFASHYEMHNFMASIANQTGAAIILEGNIFKIFGLSSEVTQAVSLLFKDNIINTFHHNVCFMVDLLPEYQEFIRGRKDGKINAIKRLTHVNIAIEEGRQQIRISGTNSQVVEGFLLFQDELPAETTFYIPEEYHGRIIGADGETIQKIIKKHTVFLRCYNCDKPVECENINHNVLARTPTKYASKLVELKREVLDLVGRAFLEEYLKVKKIPCLNESQSAFDDTDSPAEERKV